MTIEDHNAPFAPDLSVIDIAAWLRTRDDAWERLIDVDLEDTFFIEEDAA